jgi:hypothetical protein
MRRKLPPLRIHVWGGLGSQLFAVALAFELENRFPKREKVIVIHSSGVTRRSPEALYLFPEIKFIEADDYAGRTAHDSSIRRKLLKYQFIKLARLIALFVGLLAEENDGVTRKAHSWTLSIRGHYFHRPVNRNFIQILVSRLENNLGLDTTLRGLEASLHYRLGDLLELVNKKPIAPDRISEVMCTLESVNVVAVFSDSPSKALSLLSQDSCCKSFEAVELNAPSTLLAAFHSLVFVGTSSKISYWVTLMRSLKNNEYRTYMPVEDANILDLISLNTPEVYFY